MWVVRHRILVHRDIGASQHRIGVFPCDAFFYQVDKHQVIVGTARHDWVTTLGQYARHDPGVFADLALVTLERCIHRFFERDGFRSDNMHQRAALCARIHE